MIKSKICRIAIAIMSFAMCISIASCSGGSGQSAENRRLLSQLDVTIGNTGLLDSTYMIDIKREKARIRHVDGNNPDELSHLYKLNRNVTEKYHYFSADSALVYADNSIRIARKLGDKALMSESYLTKADILARSGLFHEAICILDSIRPFVPDIQLAQFYMVSNNVYQYTSEYSVGSAYNKIYDQRKRLYSDSLLQTAKPESFEYKSIRGSALIEFEKRPQEAVKYLEEALADYQPGMREYSVLVSILGYSYELMGDNGRYEECLIRAADSDVKGSIKETLATRKLSDLLLRKGDVDHANRYLQKSFQDANSYSARMRHTQAAAVFPLVTTAYQQEQSARQIKLIAISAMLCAIALAIIISYIVIRRKNRMLAQSNKEIQKAQQELLSVNKKINETNAKLNETNASLEESKRLLENANQVKQEYLSQFIRLSSRVINKMSSYRKRLYTMLKSNKKSQLIDALESAEEINEMSSDFYRSFDESFLMIMPDFREKLNMMLTSPLLDRTDDTGEQLTTEQRIYAVMYLGITDTKEIAAVLHCTTSTIYTYRSRVKAKAKSPETFESDIRGL